MTVLHPGQTASKFPEDQGKQPVNDTLPALDEQSWQRIHDSTPAELQDGAPDYQSYLSEYNANPMPRGYCGTTANALQGRFMFNQQGVGTAPKSGEKLKNSSRSKLEQLMGGSLIDETGQPDGPGFAYFNHLFNRAGGEDKIKEAKKKELSKGSNIYTEAQEALKVAIQAMGVASSYNPTGIPIDIRDAQRIWFGDEDVEEIKLKQWRSQTEMGDNKIDPKKVRKFTNYDGSMTWEILNDDKTVSSRFTLGEYAGVKVFAQGGISKFAEMLEKVKEKVGMDDSTSFDAIRSKY